MSKNIDDEIEVLNWKKSKFYRSKKSNKILWTVICFLILTVAFLLFWLLKPNREARKQMEISTTEIVNAVIEETEPLETEDGIIDGHAQNAHVDKIDTTVIINDTATVALSIYTFNRAQSVELVRVLPDTLNKDIIFATQAAFIRGDGQGILGTFVDKGEEVSKGIGAATGFVSIVNNQITIGMDSAKLITPKLQQAISDKGYFFRQYPLVHNSLVVDTRTKFAQQARICRAIGVLAHEEYDEVVVIESVDTVVFRVFAQALVRIGVKEAVNLPGTKGIFGFYRDYDLNFHRLGSPDAKIDFAKELNWIVWKNK